MISVVAMLSVSLIGAPAEARQPPTAAATRCTRTSAPGVSKSRKAATKQVREGHGLPAYGRHARKVYWAKHSNLDRDDDGTACEA